MRDGLSTTRVKHDDIQYMYLGEVGRSEQDALADVEPVETK